MRIRFVYGTAEWAKICESINLYLQYCHDIAHIKIDICNYTNKEHPCCDVLNDDDIVVIPLFEKDGSEIKSNGLDIVKYLRGKNGYKFNTIFLVLSEQDIPDHLHPEKNMHYYAETLLGNPEFGNVDKAVLLGEIIYKKKKKEAQNEKKSYENKEYMNIINLQERDALERLAKLIKQDIKLLSIDKDLRKSYYSTFVEYYECMENGEKVLNDCATKLEVLGKAQDIYNELNHPDIGTSRHAVPYELFLAPVPFPLQDLFDARHGIENELKKGGDRNKIKLLLIDNKLDKVVGNDGSCNGELIKILFGLPVSMFEFEMLGEACKSANQTFGEKTGEIQKEKECLRFRDFKKSLNKFISTKEDVSQKDKKDLYAWRVYDKIISFNFILLDFFLNKENTYLAFDFIKDIAKIKKKEGDFSTTWYFITSAVYDSVVKYSQSGLLAEYYESAVVNAGDDPTNKKRQIIFVYKLLTFIQARIRSFKGFHDSVMASKLLNCTKKECKNTQCLIENQTLFRKYLAEFGEIIKIFPGEEAEEKQFRETVELLDSTINQFIWLPEADWPMIQRQIEHINSRLEDIDDFKNRRFSCNYIREEIGNRSDIY